MDVFWNIFPVLLLVLVWTSPLALYFLIRLAVRHGMRDMVRDQGKISISEKRED